MIDITPDKELRLKRLLRLVDISGDLERNQDDSAFQKEGGKIYYVLDENVFEVFVRPFRHHQAVETFYAALWQAEGKSSPIARSFESQSAMITSEFLVARMLPGASTETVFMTEPHRWELARRVEELAGELQQRVTQDPKRVSAEFVRKLTVLKDLVHVSSARAQSRNSESDVPLLDKDMDELEKSGAAADAIDRVRVARTAAYFLAEDDLTEPLDQLRRIVTPPVRSRLRTLQVAYPPSPTKELASIEDDARNWFRLIIEELERPGHRSRERHVSGTRGKALWNDARSIAYVRWVARNKLRPNERIVFVTGDSVIFDAYRRWHSGLESKGAEFAEPFFMRRMTQYTPIFNPEDTGGDLSEPKAGDFDTGLLFSMIQQAVEAALLPLTFTLAEEAGHSSEEHRMTGPRRELLSLRLIDQESLAADEKLKPFLELLSDDWLSAQTARMAEIRRLWQEAHRLAIGSSYKLIASRLNEEQVKLIDEMSSRSSDEIGTVLNKYVSDILNRLLEDSLEVWLPLAREFWEEKSRNRSGQALPKRAYIAIDPALRTLPDRTRSRPRENTASAPSPELIFAAAACRALEFQDVNDADRFAGLAMRADGVLRARGQGVEGRDFELQYLHALTQKFLLGTATGHLGSRVTRPIVARSVHEAKLLHARASRLIHSCLSFHFSKCQEEQRGGESYHSVRYLRALSERASLNLFMATALGLITPTAETREFRDEARRFIMLSKGDLRMCLKFDAELRQRDAGLHQREDPILQAAESQFLWNVAASEVLTYLSDPDTYRMDDWGRKVLNRVDEFAVKNAGGHPLMIAELSAFEVIAQREFPAAFRSRTARRQNETDLKLPLDSALLDAIHREILANGRWKRAGSQR